MEGALKPVTQYRIQHSLGADPFIVVDFRTLDGEEASFALGLVGAREMTKQLADTINGLPPVFDFSSITHQFTHGPTGGFAWAAAPDERRGYFRATLPQGMVLEWLLPLEDVEAILAGARQTAETLRALPPDTAAPAPAPPATSPGDKGAPASQGGTSEAGRPAASASLPPGISLQTGPASLVDDITSGGLLEDGSAATIELAKGDLKQTVAVPIAKVPKLIVALQAAMELAHRQHGQPVGPLPRIRGMAESLPVNEFRTAVAPDGSNVRCTFSGWTGLPVSVDVPTEALRPFVQELKRAERLALEQQRKTPRGGRA